MAVRLRHAGQLVCAAAMTVSLALTPGSAPAAGAAARPGASAVANVSVPGFPDAIAVDLVTDTAYVALRNPLTAAGTVAVIDMVSGTVTATIPVGLWPSQIAVNPATDVIYVLNSQDGTVSVISGATDSVVTTITGLASGPINGFSNLSGLAVDPATNMAYVAISGAGSAGMIDEIGGTTNTVTGAVTGTGLTTGIAVNPATDTAYAVGTPGPGQPFAAAVIDLATGAITATIPIGGEPREITVDAATNTVYTTTWDGPILAAYSGATNTETGSVDLGGGIVGIAVNPQTDTVYGAVDDSVTADAVHVSLVNGAATAVAATIPVAVSLPAWVAVDPATDTLAVTEGDTVALISLRVPAITSISHVTFTADAPASFTAAAVGTPAATFTQTGTLPAGIKMTGTGTLSGTPGPRTGGTYHLTITAENGVAPAATQQFVLTIDQMPAFTSPSRATFRPGAWHRFTIRTTGYPAATVTKTGKLPPGLQFIGHANGTATILGTATRSARGKTYIIRLHTSNGTGHPATQRLTLKVR